MFDCTQGGAPACYRVKSEIKQKNICLIIDEVNKRRIIYKNLLNKQKRKKLIGQNIQEIKIELYVFNNNLNYTTFLLKLN